MDDFDGKADAMNNGMKFDDGKLRYGLIPPIALEQLAAVLTFGAQKYEPNSWQDVPDGLERYLNALMRHVEAYRAGEHVDPDSGLHHLAHAGTCLVFLLWLEKERGKVPILDPARLAAVREQYERERLGPLEKIQRALNARAEDKTEMKWFRQIRETGLIEYRCEHGVGHPDHASAARLEKHYDDDAGIWLVHGCDGCCRRDDFPGRT